MRIEATDLRRSFEKRIAVDGLTLRIPAGEIYGLVGPDAAGKTTTLRILAGLLDPSGGTARLVGRDPFGKDTSFREELGYMPQEYSLYGDLTVAENLAFYGEMFCLARDAFRQRRDRLLGITRLAEFKDRRAEALSGGMYKKLALACALLHEPKALLLDEPTNGVDPVSRREFWDLLHDFLSEGMAILFATSNMDEAARCHRVGRSSGESCSRRGSPPRCSEPSRIQRFACAAIARRSPPPSTRSPTSWPSPRPARSYASSFDVDASSPSWPSSPA